MLEALQEFYNNNKTMFIAIVVALASIVGFMLYRRHMTSKSGVSSGGGDNMVCDMDTGICRDHATMTPEQEQMMMQQHQQMMMMQQEQGQQQQQQGQQQQSQEQFQQQQGQDQGQEQMVSEL